jgi:hypothetical protein
LLLVLGRSNTTLQLQSRHVVGQVNTGGEHCSQSSHLAVFMREDGEAWRIRTKPLAAKHFPRILFETFVISVGQNRKF